MVEAMAILLNIDEPASPPIAKPANPQTISNDGQIVEMSIRAKLPINTVKAAQICEE
jgi:hypothetical protein